MIKSLQFHPLELGFLPVVLAAFGLGVLGSTLMMMFREMELWPLAVDIVLFLVLCSLSKRAELWSVILALQASCGVHLGVDNLNVVRPVGRLLDGSPRARPFEILKDGDLLCLVDRMLQLRGVDTVKISKVKGHADDGVVLDGRVQDLDRLGNNAADDPADFGRRRVPVHVIDARRNLVGVCNRWYPVVRHLHFFFVAIARAVVNHDDGRGTAPDPLVWSAGSLPKRPRVLHAVRDFAFLPGPVGIWDGDWVSFGVSGITVEDVGVWPYSVSLLVKVSAFLGTLHWPAGAVEFVGW